MAQGKKSAGAGKAGALLKTMGRGSPRTRAPEEDPSASPAAAGTGNGPGRATDGAPARERSSARSAAAKRGSRAKAQPAATATSPAKRRERPAKPVRITVDLDAERHRFLRDFAYREDARGTEVVRALLDELGSDAALVERVRDRLAGEEAR